jgi:hypothetical protein
MRLFSKHSSKSQEDIVYDKLKMVLKRVTAPKVKIWKVFPSYKDLDLKNTILRILFLGVLSTFFLFSLVMLTFDVILSSTLTLILLIVFLVAFSESFHFHLLIRNIIFGKQMRQIYPFDNMIFWQEKEDTSILYISNKKSFTTVGITIFKVEVIPGNIHPSLGQLIGGLEHENIPFTFQVVQKPMNYNNKATYKTEIYFCVYYQISGLLSEVKVLNLRNELEKYKISLKNCFDSDLHHFKFKLLTGSELLNALQIFSLNRVDSNLSSQESYFEMDNIRGSQNSERDQETSLPQKTNWKSFFKSFCCILYIAVIDIFLTVFSIDLLFLLLINVGFILAVIRVFWKEALFFKSNYFLRKGDVQKVSPFGALKFFLSDRTLYVKDKKGLTGIKAFSLKYIKPEIYNRNNKFINRTERFFRVILSQKIPFSYTVNCSPLNFKGFKKEGLKYLKDKPKDYLEYLESEQDRQDWLKTRKGMWRTMLTLTTSAYIECEELGDEGFQETWKKLRHNEMVLTSAFKVNMSKFLLEQIKKETLISAFKMTTQKNKLYSLNGTNLNYLILQGTTLMHLIEISDEFKRGVKTKLASEFTTPLYLENQIVFGDTINTENLDKEVPAGLKLDQTQRLLIRGPHPVNNNLFAMKIVSGLIKLNRHAIIFDFNGEWSRLIRYFSNTSLVNNFLYYKIGKTFRINPIYSDVPYDQNNIEYLDYMFDSYALAFQQNKRIVEKLKNLIKENEELDLPSLTLKMDNQKEWEKNSMTQSAISVFKDFSEKILIFSGQGEDEKSRITCDHFLSTSKTVILDFSSLRDLQRKLFLAFIIVSKIIHYVKYVKSFIPKTFVIPNVDLFFNKYYLERVSHYGKIDSFLQPLIKRGFGLIFLFELINIVHPNLLDRFPNLLSFRTNSDENELRVLKNKMNLQELMDSGFYSSKRKDAYQVHYLKTLPEDQILVKRSDQDQSFPAIISWDDLKNTSKMTDEELSLYMKKQGFNVELSEEEILNCTKKDLFEKDLGDYSIFTEEIITFLETLKMMDNVGNLYKTKLKEELKKVIYTRAALIFQKSRRKIMEARDKILDLLIKHGYLIEAHQEKASGAHTIRTSYKVSNKFEEARKMYKACSEETKEILDSEFAFNEYLIDEGEENGVEDLNYSIEREDHIADTNTENVKIKQKNTIKEDYESDEVKMDEAFRNSLVRSIGQDLIYSIAKLDKFLRKGTYEDSIYFQKQIIPNFLLTLSKDEYEYRDADLLTPQETKEMVQEVVKQPKFPFDLKDMKFFMERLDLSGISDSEIIKERTQENYEILKEILKKVQLTLYGRFNHAN